MRGPHKEVFTDTCDGLIEGPLYTGKSFCGLTWGRWMAERWPGSRGFISRKTRASMTQSTLVTWEAVLGNNHPAIHGTAGRAHRQSYLFPNKSEVVIVGMNNPEGLLSSEYDWGICDEFVEYSREDYETITGRLRNGPNSGVPFSRLLMMTNPRNTYHWVNQAAKDGLFKRYESRHWCNPNLYNAELKEWTKHGIEYLDRIRLSHSGARFEQYVRGLWSNATGMVYPQFDPAVHCLQATVEVDQVAHRIFLHVHEHDWLEEPVEIMWTAAGVDWGTVAPGSMTIWGFDKEGTAYMLAEIYRSGESKNWWADRAVEFREEFWVSRFVCDYAEPGSISLFNDYLGTPGGRESERLATRCDAKDPMGEISHMGMLLDQTCHSETNPRGARMYIIKDTLRFGRDPNAVSLRKPCCLRDELQDLRWMDNEDGKPFKEKVDPSLRDDAENGARYLLRWAWRKDLTEPARVAPIVIGSARDILGHDDKLAEIRRKQREE